MIVMHDISKRYGRQQVLDRVHLEIAAGECFALLGPNGSGKTTLLKSLLGIVRPAAGGSIAFNGHVIDGSPDYKRAIGYMAQIPRFPPHLTVRELTALYEQLRRQPAVDQEKLVRDLGIDQFWTKPFGALSGGMAQKVNILLCFMFANALYVLDEPTLGLDPHVAFYLKTMLRAKRAAGASILFTSHVMAEVDELADRMALLVEGKIYTVTSPAELKRQKGAATLEAALYQFWEGVRAT